MARVTGMSQTAVSRIWRAFGLKPHLVQTGRAGAASGALSGHFL